MCVGPHSKLSWTTFGLWPMGWTSWLYGFSGIYKLCFGAIINQNEGYLNTDIMYETYDSSVVEMAIKAGSICSGNMLDKGVIRVLGRREHVSQGLLLLRTVQNLKFMNCLLLEFLLNIFRPHTGNCRTWDLWISEDCCNIVCWEN